MIEDEVKEMVDGTYRLEHNKTWKKQTNANERDNLPLNPGSREMKPVRQLEQLEKNYGKCLRMTCGKTYYGELEGVFFVIIQKGR